LIQKKQNRSLAKS